MEMHQIRYFLAVCQTLNFTRAAEECHVAQPSLTRAIKKLEAELGGELFLRERSRTHISELGRSMLPLLTKSYESALAAKSQAELQKNSKIAQLRVGLSHSIDAQIIVPALNEVTKAVQDLEIHLVRGTSVEIEKQLEDGDIDMAVTANSDPGWERIDIWALFSEGFMVAMNGRHPLAAQSSIKLEQITSERLLMRTHCEQIQSFTTLLDQHEIKSDHCHEISTEADQEVLLMNGFGIGLVPQSIELAKGNIVKLPLQDFDMRRSLCLIAVAGRKYSQSTSLMINLLRSSDWSLYEGSPSR